MLIMPSFKNILIVAQFQGNWVCVENMYNNNIEFIFTILRRGLCSSHVPVAACEFSFFCQIVAVDVDTSRITVQLHPSEEVSN